MRTFRRPFTTARIRHRLAWSALTLIAFAYAPFALAASPAASPVGTAMAREQRVALVIGNGRYTSSPLANPVNDARAMTETLRSMGFRVQTVEDASIAQMVDAVRRFGETLHPGGIGLFFYAGHGMQIKGRNYLIPVGADIQREDEVAFNAFDAGQVLEKMEAAKSRVNIIILDACRNNPFTRSFRSSTQGLATIDAPFGSYVAMATAPGRVASDGSEGNSVYTKNLLAAMRTPGITIEDVFKRTRVKVMAATDNQQVPWDYSSLSGDFYFIPSPGVAAAQLASAAAGAQPAQLPAIQPASRPASQLVSQSPAQSAAKSTAPSLDSSRKARDPRAAAPDPQRVAAAVQSSAGDAQPGEDEKMRLLAKLLREGKDPKTDPNADYELALLLKAGRKPMNQDLPRALALFLQAAQKGHPGAQYEAARAYAQGTGTQKSCKDALGWAQKSARSGSLEGAVLAGDLNKSDCGGERNLAESARWYRFAADKGLASAQFALGVLYMNGDGVPKDLGEARKWLNAAVAQGNTSAKFYLERLPR